MIAVSSAPIAYLRPRKRRRRSTAANRYARDLSRRTRESRLMAVDLLGRGWRKAGVAPRAASGWQETASPAEAIEEVRRACVDGGLLEGP
jgi:hypothetical protein